MIKFILRLLGISNKKSVNTSHLHKNETEAITHNNDVDYIKQVRLAKEMQARENVRISEEKIRKEEARRRRERNSSTTSTSGSSNSHVHYDDSSNYSSYSSSSDSSSSSGSYSDSSSSSSSYD